MKKIFDFTKKYLHLFVFSAYMILHFLTTVSVAFFGDDYYYAAFLKNGFSYFVSENIVHYKETNGRVLVHLLDELLLGSSIWLWRIFSLIYTAALIWLIAAIASGRFRYGKNAKKFPKALIFSCVLFGSLDIMLLRETVYWATGAMNYIFPVVLTLLLFYLFAKKYEAAEGSVLLIPLAFVASYTVEQASVASFAVVFCFVFSCIFIKGMKPRITYILSLIVSIAGNILLFTAPGNAVRTTYYEEFYKLDFCGKIEHNIDYWLKCGNLSIEIVLLFLIASAAVLSARLKKANKVEKIIYSLSCIFSVFSALYTLYYKINDMDHDVTGAVLLIATAVLLIAGQCVAYFGHGMTVEIYFPLCALLLQLPMLISPLFGPRTTIISVIFLIVASVNYLLRLSPEKQSFVLIVAGVIMLLLKTTEYFEDGEYTIYLIIAIAVAVIFLFLSESLNVGNVFVAVFCSVCLVNYISVVLGYNENLPYHNKNSEAAEQYENGELSSLEIYKLKEPVYAYTMPYDSNYHEKKFKKLIGMPKENEIIYIPYDENLDK